MWITAIILGLTGSLHCAGMCSPLVIAVTKFKGPVMLNRVFYNAGRLFTYAVMGACISVFGSLFGFPQFQDSLSIAFGIICVGVGMTGITRFRIPFLAPAVQKISNFIKKQFSNTFQQKSIISVSFLGILNGLLPCGLTSLALTNCILLPTAQDGFIFMLLFGAGTLPVMLGLVSVVHKLVTRLNLSFQHMARISLIALGLLLISRSFFGHTHLTEQSAAGNIENCQLD